MASNNTPQSPAPDGYASVKTPEGHALTHEAKSGVSPWSGRYRFVGNAAQLLILVSMVVYAFGQVAYFTPIYSNDIAGTFKVWWGVPTVQTARGGGAPAAQGNSSMGQGNSTVGGGRSNSTMGATGGQGNSTAVRGGRQGNNSTAVGGGRQGNSSADEIQGMGSSHGGHGRRALSSDVWVAIISDAKAVTPIPAPAPTPRPSPTPAPAGGQAVNKGHSEMVLPTYVFFFSILPLFVSGLLIEFLRHFNVRRISSKYVLKLAMVLRRKPALFGRVSYWSYGEWIFFWALVGGNIYVFYRYFSTRINGMKARSKNGLKFNTYLEAIGLTFGFSCIFNLAFLFLPATRNCAWMEFFNISYANGVKYHRWLGVMTVLTGVLHTAGYYWSWLRQGTWKRQSLPCFDCNIAERKGYKVWFNVFGEIALIIFLIIGLTSIPYVRRKLYNVFYYTHQLLFLAVIFSVMHWASVVCWIFPTFLIYCFSRAMSMTSNFSPIEVKELTAIDSDIVKIVLKRSPGRDGHYRVGQFLYLNVPAISKLQWHAFTIASSPRTSPTTVTVLLKSLGDWTRDLAIHANECKEKNVLPTVYVDGFYGASLELYDEYSTVLLVGGGIGSTPMFAILEDLASRLANHQTLQQKVVFVFSFRELALLEEIHPVLVRLRELDPQEQYFKTHFYLTRLPSEDVLARRVDTDRLQDKHIQPTTYAPTTSTPMAFTEPLRSRTYRALAFTTVVAIGLLLIIYLEFGGGKIQRGANRYLWPLQQFVDPSMAMVAACAVFPFVLAERISKRRSASAAGASKGVELNVFQSVGTPALLISDVHTYRDLLSHYKVVLGERPNAETIVQEAYNFQNDQSVPTYGKSTIGVFVSGPDAMKRAVEYAVHGVGASHFDIHEEEFEL